MMQQGRFTYSDEMLVAEHGGIFFGVITRRAIRRSSFRLVRELTHAIGAFIDACNDRCRSLPAPRTPTSSSEIRPSRTNATRH
jgi:hypothetical protein